MILLSIRQRRSYMALTPIEILRLEHGDNDPDYLYLTDDEYQYFIDTYPNTKKRAKLIDIAILNAISFDVRERSGQEERYANQAFTNRLALLDKKYKDPTFNGITAIPQFGGTQRTEMCELANDPNRVPDTFYKGQYRGRAEWQSYRKYFYIGRNREPYDNCCRYYPLILGGYCCVVS